MGRLKKALEQQAATLGIPRNVYTPKVTQPVQIPFKARRTAKVLSASSAPTVIFFGLACSLTLPPKRSQTECIVLRKAYHKRRASRVNYVSRPLPLQLMLHCW